jgi:hypothetical protein
MPVVISSQQQAGAPSRPKRYRLTKREKVIIACLLLCYLAMIALTIATSPFASPNMFDRAAPLN